VDSPFDGESISHFVDDFHQKVPGRRITPGEENGVKDAETVIHWLQRRRRMNMEKIKNNPVKYTTLTGGLLGGGLFLLGSTATGLLGSIAAGALLGLILGAIIDQ
jgi:hypothetical protein